MKETKLRVIYNQRLAGILMAKGFVLVGMDKNADNSGRNVFFFNDTAELANAILKYIS